MTKTIIFPNPVEIQNAGGAFPGVMFVEHARNTIPACLNGLGVDAENLERHIGWDIGIEGVSRRVSDLLKMPAVYCLYSRLIIDVNRGFGHPQLILPESDGVVIPGNIGLSDADIQQRVEGIYFPYRTAARDLVAQVCERAENPVAFGMHSCTPQLSSGELRPWEIGLSTYDSEDEMVALAEALRHEGFNAALHDPYDVRHYPGTCLDAQRQANGLPNILIEVRQDLIADEAGQAKWAGILARAYAKVFAPEFAANLSSSPVRRQEAQPAPLSP